MNKGKSIFNWIVYISINKIKCLLLYYVEWLDGFSLSLEGMSGWSDLKYRVRCIIE